MGIPLAINTDAHHPNDFALMDYGIAVARRGWVTASNVINVWDANRLRRWLAGRGDAAARSPVKPSRSKPKPSPKKKTSTRSKRK
jgi:DNA polymerase (family 10)